MATMSLKTLAYSILGIGSIAQSAAHHLHSHHQRSLGHAKVLQAASGFITSTNQTITLSANSSTGGIVVLDYGRNVEGIPSFEVVSASGDTSTFEITYAETKASLNNYMSDGPLPLAAAMDTYRVNRYNITSPGPITNRLIQGAFRFQKLNLSSSSPGSSLTLRNIGVQPSTSNTPLTQLPGYFESSDESLNRIWTTGARTIQLTEIPKNSIPDFAQVSADGAVFESLAPQTLGGAVAAQLLSYNVDFMVRPDVGGFGFSVLADTLNSGIYFSCDVGKKVITVHTGSSTLDAQLNSFALPSNVSVALGSWHKVHATVAMTDISITIDNQPVIKMTQTARFVGSFGLGASFGHRATFKNLSATSPTGAVIYTHPLTNPSFMPDFFMGANPADTVVDGSRRDRIAYTGDLDVAGGAALASTHGLSFIEGSLDLLGSYQTTPGFFIPTAKIQQGPLAAPLAVNITGLIGYSFNFVTAVASTYMHTGDAAFARTWAPRIQRMLDWADSQRLPSGLFNLADKSFGGDWDYYDPPQSGVVGKFNMLYAYALQESLPLLAAGGNGSTTVYQQRLDALRTAIDTNLWSDELNAYVMSDALKTGFAQDVNALAILAGVNVNPDHTTDKILASLSSGLMQANDRPPLPFSSAVLAAGWASLPSPYASAYHLRAALTAGNSTAALQLLRTMWAPMADPANQNYTGAFWETLDASGGPGLGLTTSLCHGWAAGPTAELSKFVLGAQATKPGWSEFVVAPQTLGLTSAKGRMPTTLGTVTVDWSFDGNGLLSMTVDAPTGTKGNVTLPSPMVVSAGESVFTVNGAAAQGTSFQVQGGTKFTLTQARK